MKKTFKQYSQVLFGVGFARGIALINSIIIARLLGPNEFGKFSIFYTTMILSWQFPQAFDTTFVKYARTSMHAEGKNSFLKAVILIKLLYAALILSISYPLSYVLAHHVLDRPEVHHLLMAAIVSGLSLTFLMTLASTFQEKEQFVKYASLHAIYTASVFCILIFFKIFALDLSLRAAVLTYVAISIIIGAVSIKLLIGNTGRLLPIDADAIKKSFSLGKWIFGATCILFLFLRLDVMFLTKYADFETIGIYSAAFQMIMTVSVMTGSFSGVFLPKASNAIASKDLLKKYARESLLGIFIISAFIIALIIAAPFCIKLLYGIKYLSAGLILKILLIGWLAYVIQLPFSFLYYALNDSKTPFVLELLKLFIGVILLYYLVPAKGAVGAAISISAAMIFHMLISLAILRGKARWSNEIHG